jgi:N-acetylmuramoyl-L-alanine amidase
LNGSSLRDRIQISPNVEPRFGGQEPELIVLHYTGMADGQAAVDWLCNPISKVSCHYLIDVDGSVTQMVDESLRAWHAGVSFWSGFDDINSRSIGIEIQNLGHGGGCPVYPIEQMQRVIALCLDISLRHDILPHNIVAHSDVAPGRKIDPGEAFDWARLFEQGLGQFVYAARQSSDVLAVDALQRALAELGYGLVCTNIFDDQTKRVTEAFQRRYRPSLVDGKCDAETSDILKRLIACRPMVLPRTV